MKISEKFYSIQAEGVSVGTPAFFIRFSTCNLQCGGKGGELVKEGKATWWCDSEEVMKNSENITHEDLFNSFINENQLDNILQGRTHLVWTGGEPTLPKNRDQIKEFLYFLDNKSKSHPHSVFNEIETNGTNTTEDGFYFAYIEQINCSPKLSNSGIPENRRIVPSAIEQINNSYNSWFKFVIEKESDITEMMDTYISPFKIDCNKVIIMPAVNRAEDLQRMTRFSFDMAKKYGYRCITRQHILAWGMQAGV